MSADRPTRDTMSFEEATVSNMRVNYPSVGQKLRI